MRVHRARHAIRVLVVATVVATAFGVQAQTAGAAEITYPQRLAVAKRVARQYSRGASPGSPLAPYGLWAGIVLQTKWQNDSGRAEIPLWNLVNFGLAVEPSAYATERAKTKGTRDPSTLCAASAFVQSNPTPQTVGPSVDRTAVCQAWMQFFNAEKQGVPTADLQRLLWAAHTTSIVHSLRVYGGAFERPDVSTELERNFWASWTELVLVLAAMNYPTDGSGTQQVQKVIMPPCSPLGGAGCALTPADLGSSFPFVSAMAARPASLERIFSLYEVSRSNPAALAPEVLAFSDPSLAAALAAFLAA
jgi:hypothetical protein